MELISAKEAAQRTINKLSAMEKSQLEDIMKRIGYDSRDGKFNSVLWGLIFPKK